MKCKEYKLNNIQVSFKDDYEIDDLIDTIDKIIEFI